MDPTIESLRREIAQLRTRTRLQLIGIFLVGAPWLLAAADPENRGLAERMSALEKGIKVDKDGNTRIQGRLEVTGHPNLREPLLRFEGAPRGDGVQSSLQIGRGGSMEYIQFIVQEGTDRNVEFSRVYDGKSERLRFNSDRWLSY